MNISKTDKIIFDHVKISDTGSLLLVVFDIDEGYRRGGIVKSDKGECVALFAVSNLKANESKMNYEMQKNEKTYSIFGFIVHNKTEAEILSEFFKYIADHEFPASEL